jgi:hypothetical protein
MNDTVALAARQAAEAFGKGDGTFNAAGFGHALKRIADLDGGIDGKLVSAILSGRRDIEVLAGGSHFRINTKAVRYP